MSDPPTGTRRLRRVRSRAVPGTPAPRPTRPGLVVDLLALGTATLGECGAVPLPPGLRPAWSGARLAAPALPVRCAAGDNLALHVAVSEAAPGTALVAVTDGDPDRGYWGEVLTVAAQARALAGLIIDAGVRDTAGLARRGFPVFSSQVAIRGATKQAGGCVGAPVTVGPATVEADDWVVADEDGVVVVPRAELERCRLAGAERARREAALFDELAGGATTVGLLGLDTGTVERHRS